MRRKREEVKVKQGGLGREAWELRRRRRKEEVRAFGFPQGVLRRHPFNFSTSSSVI